MQQKSEFAELLTLKPIRWQWRSGKQNPSKVAPLHVTQSECDRVYASNAIIASEIKQRRSNEQAPALDRPSFAQLEEDIEKRRLASEKLQKIIDLLALGDDFGVAQLLLGDNNLVHFRYGIEFSSEEGKEEVMMSGETLLHLGCRKKNHRVVQLLVDFNSDVNARSLEPHYNTPLHIAAMADDREIIDILLANGAESKVVNYREETAFLCSCKAGAEKTCQQILELNILGDINVRNCEGRSALWFACSTGLRDIAIELIKLGASLTEEPDSNQQSLLHAACSHNQASMAIFLINNGSSPQGKGIFPDRRGELPFDLIRDKHVRDALTNAEMEFSAAGGLTGLRLRRKEAEAVQNPSGFNWFRELQSVDARKGITTTRAEGLYLVHASKHGQVKDKDKDKDKDKEYYSDRYNRGVLRVGKGMEGGEGGGGGGGGGEGEGDDGDYEEYDENDEDASNSNTDAVDLIAQLGAAFDEKQLQHFKAKVQSINPEAEFDTLDTEAVEVPSIYAFLIERCAFPERRAKRCAHIAKMRNIMHINKLYDVMLTVEAMKVTNFSFKDIGVFHRDEKRVTAALKSYFGEGVITSFGRNVMKEEENKAKSGTVGDVGRVVNQIDIKLMCYRSSKANYLGRRIREQKYQPEEIDLMKEQDAADAIKYLFH